MHRARPSYATMAKSAQCGQYLRFGCSTAAQMSSPSVHSRPTSDFRSVSEIFVANFYACVGIKHGDLALLGSNKRRATVRLGGGLTYGLAPTRRLHSGVANPPRAQIAPPWKLQRTFCNTQQRSSRACEDQMIAYLALVFECVRRPPAPSGCAGRSAASSLQAPPLSIEPGRQTAESTSSQKPSLGGLIWQYESHAFPRSLSTNQFIPQPPRVRCFFLYNIRKSGQATGTADVARVA